ncbi:MAG: polysaccharide deacetylase family protein [Desulfosoma sp.]
MDRSTATLLDVLEEGERCLGRPVKATFFVLGSVAERFPQLVHEIHRRGHEVASHGYWHRLCVHEKPCDLQEDLMRSKALLEDILGSPVLGYRAPGFSISDRILEQVEEAGYRYDSSYNSFGLNPRYGTLTLNGTRRGIAYEVQPKFYELPVSNLKILGRTLPWAGGGYFRLVPFDLFAAGVSKILRSQGAYVFYMHPWECDPMQPRVCGVDPVSRFRHYVNLSRTAARLLRLIMRFGNCRFMSCTSYLNL